MFLLIVLSGNPLAIYSTEWIYAVYVVVLFLYLWISHKLVLSDYVCKWLIGFTFLFVAQLVVIRTVSIPADVNFIAKFLIAYITVWICGKRFCRIYTNVMYIICLISLFCFILYCVHVPIPGLRFNRYITIGIWNSIYDGEVRNSGMFWEPGAFQGFIMLPFLFYIGKLKWFWKHERKRIIVFALSMLSTLSTTAYLVAFAFAFLMLMTAKVRMIYKVALIGVASLGAVYAFFSLDFLGAKIQDQVEKTKINGSDNVSWSRTGAMLIEISNLARHPLVGNGFLLDSRYKGFGEEMSGAGNGLFGMINMLGLPMAIAYFIGVAHSWRNTRKAYRYIVVIILIMLLFGEFFLSYPLFWGLLFVKVPNIPLRRQRCSIAAKA